MIFFIRQESGFVQHSLHEVVAEIKKLPGLHLAVVLTHFPCLLWDEAAGKVLPTPNLQHAGRNTDQLAKSGIAIEQLNAPSATQSTFAAIAGAIRCDSCRTRSCADGTIQQTSRAIPSRTYRECSRLSDISHFFRGDSYCYSGGYDRRGHAQDGAGVYARKSNNYLSHLKTVDDSSIDYRRWQASIR
ncbi:hypothetical protein ACNKHT_21970 [Shigella flexneri]